MRSLTQVILVLGALSKSMATIATQPLIVAKVGLQSRPPPGREGKPFKSFGEVIRYILDKEGPLSLFKGIGPQIMKGLLVQGLLMMTKERYVLFIKFSILYDILLTIRRMELLFIMLFAYMRNIKEKNLQKTVDTAAAKAKTSLPATLK